MEFHNDRRTVEVLLWPLLMHAFVLSQVECQRDDEELASLREIEAGINAMSVSILQSMEPKRARKIADRARRVAGVVSAKHLEGRAGGTVALTLYYGLESMLSVGTLGLDEGSPFAEAINKLLLAMDRFFEQGRQDAAAQKNARKLIKTLQAEGYYGSHPTT